MHASVIDAAGPPERSGPADAPTHPDTPLQIAGSLQKRRLRALIDYVQQSTRSRTRVVSNVTDHGMFLLFQHQIAAIDGARLDDAGPDGEDEIWLSLPRPPSPELPPGADNPWLVPWLAVGIAMLVAPKLLDRVEGAALIAAGTHRDASLPAVGMDDMVKPAVLPEQRIDFADYAFRSEVEKQFSHYMEAAWVPWADAERRRRRLSRLYVQLFTLHQQMSGSLVEAPVELVWGIGLGVVTDASNPVAYPVITRLVDLSLNQRTGAVEIRPRDLEPRVELDFYGAGEREGAERSLVNQAEQVARDLLARSPTTLSPFDASTYEPVLNAVRDVLAGQALARRPELALTSEPREPTLPALKIDPAWVLFARPRSANLLIQDLDRFHRALEQLPDDQPLPEALAALVSDPSAVAVPVELPRFRGVSAPFFQRSGEVDAAARDLFFPRPFNDEQVRIVQLLEASDGVAVQGPPGTGKTHTIANIICHWLATGRRVLVTSMKEPALAVLREKLPEEIRPLAIALLGSEHEGMQQFEQSVQTIASQVQSLDRHATAGEVAQLEETIDGLHTRLMRIDTEIGRWARLNQARIDLDGESVSPMDAAQEVIDHAGQYEWIPDALGIGPQYAPRFTEDDMARLRQARRQLGTDIDYVGRELPPLSELPDARTLLLTHQGLAGFARRGAEGVGERPQLAAAPAPASDLRDLSALVERVKALREDILHTGSGWSQRMRARLRDGSAGDETSLLDALGRELQEALALRKRFLARPVSVPLGAELDAELAQAIDNLAQGRRPFGLMAGFARGDARRHVEAVRVSGQLPADTGDWKHVADYLVLQRKLRALGARWNAVAADLGLEPVRADNAHDVIHAASQFSLYRKVRMLVDAEGELVQCARRLFPTWPAAGRVADDAGAALQLEKAIEHYQTAHQLGEIWVSKARLQKALEGRGGRVVEDLRVFLADVLGNPKVDEGSLLGPWAALMAELSRLHRLVPAMQTVVDVTQRIAQSGAPLYAQRLLQPVDGSGDALLPPNWRRAWRLRSLATHLALIDPQDEFRKLTRLRADLEHDLSRAYNAITVKRSWLKLAENATPSVRAALQAYLNAIQRLGKGTGKRAARYRQDARNAAAEANAAIPCWIMPHYRVSESLPAKPGCFDLVIIDEASQSDLSALPAMFRGRKLLIVGDDKQVSPEGVGLEEERIKSLMQRYLAEQVPMYRAQMSADRSIYDLAKVVFARSGVMLKEHFRCVAPIIEYSKREFYGHELHPLRLPPASERLDPPLVDVLLEDGRREGDLNPAEARFIVDEIKRLIADERMRERSIGVVSLLGDAQAVRIWDMLGEELGPQALQRLRIACGDARTFQGRERDVMFLSLVCAPNDVGAPLARETFAQRFNVAASRARDRMYLVRSVEAHHLAEGDRLRRGLLAHFAAPFPDEAAVEGDARGLCESPLERDIYDWLLERGYRVRPQLRVGAYRIDLVVEGDNDARLAIECDGDKYHGADKWTADVRRQRVLERAGWQFWRCFASTFVRRRDAVFEDLAAVLAARGIHPLLPKEGSRPQADAAAASISEQRRVRAPDGLAAGERLALDHFVA
jgi:very-short-patch-repair endonuclease